MGLEHVPVDIIISFSSTILFLDNSFTSQVNATLGSPKTFDPIPWYENFEFDIESLKLEKSIFFQSFSIGKEITNWSAHALSAMRLSSPTDEKSLNLESEIQ